MESSSIDYNTERFCNLTQVGERLDDKNYGIGMRKSECCLFMLLECDWAVLQEWMK